MNPTHPYTQPGRPGPGRDPSRHDRGGGNTTARGRPGRGRAVRDRGVRDGRRGWGRSNRWAADRGGVTVEFAILAPVVFFLLMAIVQFGLWAHATHIAQLAATEAAGVTRFYGGSTTAGEQAARAELDRHLGTLNAVTVTVTLTGAEATVTVEGAAVGVLPGLALPVGASATAPREVPDQP